MIGFVYIWYDCKHKMYCVGSHFGKEDDGYITGSRWMKNAYRRRPGDFKRKILERIFEGDLAEVRKAEQRWLDMIKPEELSVKYYNIKSVADGFDRLSASRGGTISGKNQAKIKDSDGASSHFRRIGKIGARNFRDSVTKEEASELGRRGGIKSMHIKDENGKSKHAVKIGKISGNRRSEIKDPDGVISHLRSMGKIGGSRAGAHKIKDKDGKSVHARKIGIIAGHIRWHVNRNIVNENCELCRLNASTGAIGGDQC